MNFVKELLKIERKKLQNNELLEKYENNPKLLLLTHVIIFGNKTEQKKIVKKLLKDTNANKIDYLKIDKIDKKIIFLLEFIKKQQINNNCKVVPKNKGPLQYMIWNYDNIYKELKKINFNLADFLAISRIYNIVNIILIENEEKIKKNDKYYLFLSGNARIEIYTPSVKISKNNFLDYSKIKKLKNNEILLKYFGFERKIKFKRNKK